MSAVLTGSERFSLATAAKKLGVAYATVRRYVVDRAAVPSIRRGIPRNADARKHGCKVLIDEVGLETLRQMLPPNPDDERSEQESQQSASTGSAVGLSGSL